ncbi:PREDICTED: uncharacterized protein LOC109216896 [Nicotiana attenuata]|uniref:uncharacterized protein LOC109216896 n=1 Tax=Nicotiana attenuata TaxID=49451 RepID=UPI0009049506|nr:PREDICTED: uncharacterized protein LOC109216896 [Nicotiana attenuata]
MAQSDEDDDLINDKQILTIELGEAEQSRDDLVVCVVDRDETIANLEIEKEALNERITSLNNEKHTSEEKVASTEEERDDLLAICTDLEDIIEGLNREHMNVSLGKGKEVASETHIMLEKELNVVKTSLCSELERNQQLQAELEKVRNDLEKFLKWTWSLQQESLSLKFQKSKRSVKTRKKRKMNPKDFIKSVSINQIDQDASKEPSSSVQQSMTIQQSMKRAFDETVEKQKGSSAKYSSKSKRSLTELVVSEDNTGGMASWKGKSAEGHHLIEDQVSKEKSDSWIVDSGATHHISSTLNLISDVSKVKGRDKVTLPNGGCAKIEHVGSSYLSAIDKLKNVLHNLYNGRVKGIGKEEGLYVLKGKGIKQLATHVGVKVLTGDTWDLWHKRLGHASIPVMQHVSFLQNKVDSEVQNKCFVCPLAKQSRLSFPDSEKRSTRPFELVHMDVWGPYKKATHDRKHYFLTVVDDFSRPDFPASEDVVPAISGLEESSQGLYSDEEPRGHNPDEPTMGHHDVDAESAPHMEETNEPAMGNPNADEVTSELPNNADCDFAVHAQLEDIVAPDEIHPVESSSNVPV